MSERGRSWLDGKRKFSLPFRPGAQIDRDVDDEIAFHLERRAAELESSGMTPEEASSVARREFGDPDVARRELRRFDRSVEKRRRRALVFEELWRDVVHSVRSFWRQPGFFVTTVLVLGLGLGAATTMFQLVNLLGLQPVLMDDPSELVVIYSRSTEKGGAYRGFSYPNYRDLAEQSRALESVAAQNISIVGLREGDSTRRVIAGLVAESYFKTLGVSPREGRVFTPEESTPDSGAPVAVVSHSLSQRLGAGESLLGKTIGVNDLDLVVVGVMPPGFTGTTAMFSPDFWMPLGLDSSLSRFGRRPRSLNERDNHALLLFGRRRDGCTLDDVRADLALVGQRLAAAHPGINGDQELEIGPMTRLSLSTAPSSDSVLLAPMLLILAMAVVVLLIACLNLANMQLARGSARAGELAVRTALGGGRWRLVRQMLTEGLVLSLAGGLMGLLIASWVIRVLFGSLSGMLPIGVSLSWSARPDLRVLLATAGFCVFATVVFSLGPALRSTRASVVRGLRAGGRDGHDATSRLSPRQVFLAAQIALSLVLLVGGGLVARGASRVAEVDPGFDIDHAVLIDLDPSLSGADETTGRSTYRRVLETVRARPGVEAAGMTAVVPFGSVSSARRVRRAELEDLPENTVAAQLSSVDSGYFDAIGLDILQGRGFTAVEDEAGDSAPVVVVDQPLAERLWPDGSAVGRSIRFSGTSAGLAGEYRVVGVVPGTRQQMWDESLQPHVFLPFGDNYTAAMTVHVRLDPGRNEAEAIADLRREILRSNPGLAVLDARTWRDHRAGNVVLWGLGALGRLVFVFGVLALFLAIVGVYGVRSFLVSRRTRELGVRQALGATPRGLLGMVVQEGARLTLIAAGIGLVLSLGLGRLLASVIRGVEAVDPLVVVVSLVVLLAGTTLASYLPARRATRVSPTVALRAD